MSDDVLLKVNGQTLKNWTDVSIKRSVEAVSGTFKLSVIDIWRGDSIFLEPQMDVDIYIGDDMVMRGYIDERGIDIGPESNSISVSGRCKTGDLVDCSVTETPGSWRDIDPLKLIAELCYPFDITVNAETDLGERLKDFTINSGESVFEVISRICENRAILPISDNKGNLLLTTIGNEKASDKLIYEYNVVGAQLNESYKERYSLIRVKAQQSGKGESWNKSHTGVIGEATDENILRWRPKVIIPGSQVTNTGANKRAAWEAQVRAGRSATINVNVVGWRQYNGDLWKENLLTHVVIPKIGVDGSLVIKEVEYTLDAGQRSLTMALSPPEIYAPQPKGKIKKKKSKRNVPIWR